MKMNKKTIAIVIAIVLACAAVVAITVYRSNADAQNVLTAKVTRENLASIVSGTGQITPKTYVNVGAQILGRVTHLYAREGDHVHKGEVVATIESVPQSASVAAQQAMIDSSRKDIAADLAAEKVEQANIEKAQADLQQKQLDYQRAQQLYLDQLMSKQ